MSPLHYPRHHRQAAIRTPNHSSEDDDHLYVTKDVYSVADKQIHRQQIYLSGATAVTRVWRLENELSVSELAILVADDARAEHGHDGCG